MAENQSAAQMIADMAKMSTLAQAEGKPFYEEYEFPNGTKLGVSQNPLTGAQGRFFATLPLNAEGEEEWERAEEWQTLGEVADRIALLYSE